MRVLAIGDIHGCLRALDGVLEMVRPQSDDEVVTLGDYVDRGPNSRGVVDRLLELRGCCLLVPLRGNHDQMMLDAREDPDAFREWMMNGGGQTLLSYTPAGGPGNLDNVPERHWDFLELTQPFCQNQTHMFVHANVDSELPLHDQPPYLIYWEKLGRDPRPHCSGKVLICGHTAQKSGLPLDLGHTVCIDTYVYGRGWLTCLDVRTGEYWQANQIGESRVGRLTEGLTRAD